MIGQDAAGTGILIFSVCVLWPITRCWRHIQPLHAQLVFKFSSAEKGFSALNVRKKIMESRKPNAAKAFSACLYNLSLLNCNFFIIASIKCNRNSKYNRYIKSFSSC
jgi:hypothetical protein